MDTTTRDRKIEMRDRLIRDMIKTFLRLRHDRYGRTALLDWAQSFRRKAVRAGVSVPKINPTTD
jgi:hypothetical protein